MKELGITKGEWMPLMGRVQSMGDEIGDIVCLSPKDYEDSMRNWSHHARLISDAGNTAQKCGLLPSELLKQRDELLEALKEAKETIRVWHGFMEVSPTEAKAWEYYQKSPEMKKINEAITKAEER